LSLHIKEEYYYYQYINLMFLRLLGDLSMKLLKLRKLAFLSFGITTVMLKLLNKSERFCFGHKLLYSQVKLGLTEQKV
jgi:hypothetical protein